MNEPYKDKIEAHCKEAGVEIPLGFYRHPASRYVAIDLEFTPPRLVAMTWYRRKEVAYYLVNLSAGRKMRVLDFKGRFELRLNAKGDLERAGIF